MVLLLGCNDGKFIFTSIVVLLLLLSIPNGVVCGGGGGGGVDNNNNKSISPTTILSSQFEASLAASEARGSAIAVSFDNNVGTVLLWMTSLDNIGGSGSGSGGAEDNDDNNNRCLKLHPNMKNGNGNDDDIMDNDETSSSSLSSAITELCPNRLYCCMTGLGCDVQHLRKCWAQELLVQRDYILASSDSGVDKWIRNQMAQPLKESCWTSGRPYGVQALMVSASTTSKKVIVYTLDPSGQVHTWSGGGTAIGKQSRKIRESLHQLLLENNNDDNENNSCVDNNTWEDSCRIAMKALLLANTDNNQNDNPNNNMSVEGMVIHSPSNLSSFQIPPSFLQKCKTDCQPKMDSQP